jgi:hypothetical protein
MHKALNNALSQPDVEDILLSAIEHADLTIRKYIWRGFKPKAAKAVSELMVGDKTAKDFVGEALKRLCAGQRTYDSDRSLLENINSVADSLIWSDKKASDRTGITDYALQPGEPDEWSNPLSKKPTSGASPDAALANDETVEFQNKWFESIKESFDGDPETQSYLDALGQGFFDIEEISTLTDIPVAKIYEIRRKLKEYALRFFEVSNYAELERKIEETT